MDYNMVCELRCSQSCSHQGLGICNMCHRYNHSLVSDNGIHYHYYSLNKYCIRRHVTACPFFVISLCVHGHMVYICLAKANLMFI